MARTFDLANNALQELFKFQTIHYIVGYPYLWLPLLTAAANGIDIFLITRETNDGKEQFKQNDKRNIEVISRMICFNLIDITSLCFGSYITYSFLQSKNIINTMLN